MHAHDLNLSACFFPAYLFCVQNRTIIINQFEAKPQISYAKKQPYSNCSTWDGEDDRKEKHKLKIFVRARCCLIATAFLYAFHFLLLLLFAFFGYYKMHSFTRNFNFILCLLSVVEYISSYHPRMCWVVCFTTRHTLTRHDPVCVISNTLALQSYGLCSYPVHVISSFSPPATIVARTDFGGKKSQTHVCTSVAYVSFMVIIIIFITKQNIHTVRARTHTCRINESQKYANMLTKQKPANKQQQHLSRVFIFLVCLTEFDSDDWFSGKCLTFMVFFCVLCCLRCRHRRHCHRFFSSLFCGQIVEKRTQPNNL